jgi:hypothetical protein
MIRDLNGYGFSEPFSVPAKRKGTKFYTQALELGAIDNLEKPISTEKMNWVHSKPFRNLPEEHEVAHQVSTTKCDF